MKVSWSLRRVFITCVLACAIGIVSVGVFQYNSSEVSRVAWNEVVDYARGHFPLQGVLRVKSDGYAYVKVDDAYVHELFPMLGLRREGYREPPYFRSVLSPGAHISVFYANEHVSPKEVGEVFHFTLRDIVIVRPSRYVSYAVLQVDAPELERLREKYGLRSKLQGHEFHISLAVRKDR